MANSAHRPTIIPSHHLTLRAEPPPVSLTESSTLAVHMLRITRPSLPEIDMTPNHQ